MPPLGEHTTATHFAHDTLPFGRHMHALLPFFASKENVTCRRLRLLYCCSINCCKSTSTSQGRRKKLFKGDHFEILQKGSICIDLFPILYMGNVLNAYPKRGSPSHNRNDIVIQQSVSHTISQRQKDMRHIKSCIGNVIQSGLFE